MMEPVVAKKKASGPTEVGGESPLLSWDLCKKIPAEFTVLYIHFQP